jgi:menaquinone-dependent protoporphyrinogen oxidase
MAKCLVIYGSRYGSTREVAQAVAEGLEADVADAADRPDLTPYEVVVVGSPIYAGDYLDSVLDLICANRDLLAERKTAAFITAAADMQIEPGLTGDEDELLHTQQDYADGLAALAGGHLLDTRGFGGRLVPEQLDESDRKMLSWFYRFLMHDELKGFDLLDLPAAKAWGEQLKAKL